MGFIDMVCVSFSLDGYAAALIDDLAVYSSVPCVTFVSDDLLTTGLKGVQ